MNREREGNTNTHATSHTSTSTHHAHSQDAATYTCATTNTDTHTHTHTHTHLRTNATHSLESKAGHHGVRRTGCMYTKAPLLCAVTVRHIVFYRRCHLQTILKMQSA